jgi:hypothetical protein
MAAFCTLTWPMAGNSSGASLASRTGHEACQCSPLAPRLVQWLQMAAENRVQWLHGFITFLNLQAKIKAQLAGIYRGFGTYA